MQENENREIAKYSTKNRRLKQAKYQRQVRKNQKRLNRLYVLYKLILVFSLILFCYFVVKLPQWRLNPNAFDNLKNQSLEIVNNRIAPSQKVLSALRRNQVPREPIFMVKTDNLKNSILKLEPVQDVYIRRFWFPARLKIIIIERTPILTISPDVNVPPIAYFSTDGKLIGREYLPLDESYKTYLVITYGNTDDYRNWDLKKITEFRKLAELIESETGEKIEYIDYRNPKDVYVKIPTVNIRLGSLNAGVYSKVGRLPTLLPQVRMLNKKVKYIDLRWNSNFLKLAE